MKPDYLQAAAELKAEGISSRLAVLDCIEHSKIAEEYAIAGFPTIKLFINGNLVTDYKGNRSVEDLKKFVKESNLSTKDEL